MTLQLPKSATLCRNAQWNILVVDDEGAQADRCAAVLKDDGYSVATAYSAHEALKYLHDHPIDLVLTDMAMPQMDGMQLLAYVKEMYPDVGVVVMTASNMIEDALEAMRRGAADFLSKPFEPRDLKKLMAGCLTAINTDRDKAFAAQSSAMLELARLLSTTTDAHSLPVRALELACQSFHADSAILLACDAAAETLSVLAHAGAAVSRWGQSNQVTAQGKEAIRQNNVFLAADPGTGDCYVYAPMKAADQVRGVLCLRRAGGPWFHEKSIELLQIYATHLAVALETANLYDLASQQVSDLEEMLTESRTLSLTTDRERLSRQLLASAQRLTGAELCAVLFVDGETPQLRTAPVLPEDSPLLEAVRSRMMAILEDPSAYPSSNRLATATRRQLASFISAPVLGDGCKSGLLAAFSSRPACFSFEDTRRLSTIAESASLALANTATLARVSVLYHETVELLANMADAVSPHNAGHSAQVRTYAGELARALGIQGAELFRIEDGALLHDIGKIRIAETLLNKPAPLTAEEYAVVTSHPVIGAELLLEAAHLRDLVPIVRHHHEHFDGTGYPDRLQGEAIPLGARMTALADVFDALVSHRVYRSAMPVDEARRLLAEKAGSQFDPQLVRVFLSLPLESLLQH